MLKFLKKKITKAIWAISIIKKAIWTRARRRRKPVASPALKTVIFITKFAWVKTF
jgi:hypothetical protein